MPQKFKDKMRKTIREKNSKCLQNSSVNLHSKTQSRSPSDAGEGWSVGARLQNEVSDLKLPRLLKNFIR